MAIAAKLVDLGATKAAVAMMLQLDTYMKPGKVIGFQLQSIIRLVTAAGKAYRGRWAINLAPQGSKQTTKTGEQDESIMIEDAHNSWFGPVLQSFLNNRKPNSSPALFDLSVKTYGYKIDRAASACLPRGAAALLSPHVIRHSGASGNRYQKRRSLLQVQKTGRWKSLNSVRHYEKEALILQAWNLVPEDFQLRIKATATLLPEKLVACLGFGQRLASFDSLSGMTAMQLLRSSMQLLRSSFFLSA
eukprot:TRINITY_DN66465_c0_g1_i1.p1 TRINITY_DN66465_c0_g1~~TRINITY_DN66465_c0_g1_i1.p1  ORF type:complete len:278 (+),score=64.60 TRINITY_DN66465_c0_g1_i1:97-834(+)